MNKAEKRNEMTTEECEDDTKQRVQKSLWNKFLETRNLHFTSSNVLSSTA